MKTEVTHAEFLEALRPLFDLIDVDPQGVYADGFRLLAVDAESISGYLAERPVGAADEDAVDLDGTLGWPFKVAVA